MSPLTGYNVSGAVAEIKMDDGKVNALSAEMLGSISACLDRAEEEEAEAVVLTGTGGTFSAGFDLRTELDGWPEMLVAGARLAERMLSFPRPIVAACNGNALAMGGFVLLSADHRVGARGDYKIGLNEVRIGLTVPWFGIEIARHRLTAPYFDRCTASGVVLGPEEATAAGFLDELADPGDVRAVAHGVAEELTSVKPDAHAATKLRIRAAPLAGIRDGIDRIENREQPDW
ncbi:MAG TPA: crotonase/enoyl-CoA hydratase family protein [Solirubrobacterales bacterium]|nr:crotonase/enoyl-CoA hydratase family protein [Solirubrobacterales bacterium]